MTKTEPKRENNNTTTNLTEDNNNTAAPPNENNNNLTNMPMMAGMGMNPMMMGMGMNPMMMGQMNPMMGGVPGMMGNGPANFQYCDDPLKELAQCTGAIIRQEIEMFEVISGCETQNRYQVFIQSPTGLKYAFQCSEKSCCCSRCCCSNDCRSLTIIMRHMTSAVEDPDLAKIYIGAEKPCALGCLCCCRPNIRVMLADDNKYIGRVSEPFTCCDRDAEVYDKNDNLRYRITGDCCQVGFCCGASAEKMVEIEFKIQQNNQFVGMMKKMNASLGEYFSKADSYKISFPKNATPEEKLLLIIAGLLIDYQNFEKDSTPKKNLNKKPK
jgi:hypothetical protein